MSKNFNRSKLSKKFGKEYKVYLVSDPRDYDYGWNAMKRYRDSQYKQSYKYIWKNKWREWRSWKYNRKNQYK